MKYPSAGVAGKSCASQRHIGLGIPVARASLPVIQLNPCILIPTATRFGRSIV